jgi:hypothetical protein
MWWAHKGSNLGPLPCEGNALPLSYAPGIWCAIGSLKNQRRIGHGQCQRARFTKCGAPVSSCQRAKTDADSALKRLILPDSRFSLKTNLSRRINVIWGVQMDARKYFLSGSPQIKAIIAPSRLIEGRFAIVTDVRRDAVDAEGASDESA